MKKTTNFKFGAIAFAFLSLTAFTNTVKADEKGATTVGDDFIAFEAESTTSELGTNWVITYEGGTGDDDVAGDLPASGGAYIETTTGNVGGTGASGGVDMLQYKFTPKTSGTYTLTGRMAQNLSLVTDTKKWDKCNDILLKMEGDYTATATPLAYLQAWNKYYGRGYENNLPKWGAFVKLDVVVNGTDTKYNAVYTLKAGEEYTLSISARSKGLIIDYFLLKKTVTGLGENVDIATLFSDTYRPEGGFTTVNETYKGTDFTPITSASQTTIAASDFVTAKADYLKDADGNQTYMSIVDWCKWGAAEVEYKGEDADVNVFINTILEEDGESTYKVFVDDTLIGEVTNDYIYGTTTPNYTIKESKLTAAKIAITNGAKIRVEFCSATNGKVPEGTTTATSRGRWASVVITTSESISSDSGSVTAPSTGNILAADVFNFEASSVWNLWNNEGPFWIVDNTEYDEATYGSKIFSYVGGGSESTYTGGSYMNANVKDEGAINGFKFQNDDEYTLYFDAKIIESGASVNFLVKNITDAATMDVAAAYSIITPTMEAGEWSTYSYPLVNAKGTDGTLYDVHQILLTHYMGTTDDPTSYRLGEYLLDNIKVVPDEGFTPASIEDATIVTSLGVMASGDAIVVKSVDSQVVNVYTISGQLIQSTVVKAGTSTTVASGLAKGIYVVNNQKVVVK